MAETNNVCKDCLKWEKFKHDCWVHWEGKRECTQKVTNPDEMI